MIELSDSEILSHLQADTIGRNGQLSTLIRLLNSIKENRVLAIDGAWGSGKTVFIRQLLLLANQEDEQKSMPGLDTGVVNNLRENQKAFYFNAWEHDYLDDALGALLLRLISEQDSSLQEESLKRAFAMIDVSAGIKNISKDFINTSAQTEKDKLIHNIKELVDRHAAVNSFIDDLKDDEKRLIFVIDELDRCRPSFAVDILEVIKHYFMRPDVTFIITTNLKQLSHTIKKYYGNDFDGYAYLNKFFDFMFGLRGVAPDLYATRMLDWSLGGSVVNGVAYDAIRYYRFEMREINAYHAALQMIVRYLGKSNNWRQDQYPTQRIFTPLALALKIKDHSLYDSFVSGRGEQILREFISNTTEAVEFAKRFTGGRSGLGQEGIKADPADALVEEYRKLFDSDGVRHGSDNLQDFREAIALIGSYTTVITGSGE